MKSLATRLATWYLLLFGALLLLVTLATSLLLVARLGNIYREVFIAKSYEAHHIVADDAKGGAPLAAIAPRIAEHIGATGLGVAVFDAHGAELAGDPAQAERGRKIVNDPEFRAKHGAPGPGSPVIPLSGGFVVLIPSSALIWSTLAPYWWLAGVSLLAVVVITWFVGRTFAMRALQPLVDVTDALSTLAAGDFSRRTFAMGDQSEIGTLTTAYNAAAERVAGVMDERSRTELRMRQFVADAGHELRTPLTVIAGYIDVLRRGALAEPAVAAHILETMRDESGRMRTLIERLLRLARLDSEAPPQPAPFDLSLMVQDVADITGKLMPQELVNCRVDGPATVNADEGELREALRAIIDNAMKYAPGAPLEIAVSRNGTQALLTVSDHGPGMSEDERAHAFERFFRGESRGDVSGSGLGLAIAKRAVERAGGTIGLDAAQGHGTTVTIRLPLSTF